MVNAIARRSLVHFRTQAEFFGPISIRVNLNSIFVVVGICSFPEEEKKKRKKTARKTMTPPTSNAVTAYNYEGVNISHPLRPANATGIQARRD